MTEGTYVREIAGCGVTSPHFEERDNLVYDKHQIIY